MDVTGAATLSNSRCGRRPDLDDIDVTARWMSAAQRWQLRRCNGQVHGGRHNSNTAAAGTMGVTGAAMPSSTLMDGDTDLDDVDADGTLDVSGATGVERSTLQPTSSRWMPHQQHGGSWNDKRCAATLSSTLT